MAKKSSRSTKTISKQAAYKEITISKSGTCAKAEISKSKKDEVRWKSAYGPWVVHFKRSPFPDDTFNVPKGKKSKWSGPATKDEGTYPYDVNGSSASADPDIIVRG